ncbi:MAG: hypothetical protein H6779_03575 [Candidatus Nomurabacteria bacterium]|nr:hypothetical protein [Candidatus Nomurabacteria bacterium]USN87467.1 MAG: hypothetical protein H6779_03575 [Candidatus Nomurabacteria bacterium]
MSEKEKFIADVMIRYNWSRKDAEETWSKSQLIKYWLLFIFVPLLATFTSDFFVVKSETLIEFLGQFLIWFFLSLLCLYMS